MCTPGFVYAGSSSASIQAKQVSFCPYSSECWQMKKIVSLSFWLLLCDVVDVISGLKSIGKAAWPELARVSILLLCISPGVTS